MLGFWKIESKDDARWNHRGMGEVNTRRPGYPGCTVFVPLEMRIFFGKLKEAYGDPPDDIVMEYGGPQTFAEAKAVAIASSEASMRAAAFRFVRQENRKYKKTEDKKSKVSEERRESKNNGTEENYKKENHQESREENDEESKNHAIG